MTQAQLTRRDDLRNIATAGEPARQKAIGAITGRKVEQLEAKGYEAIYGDLKKGSDLYYEVAGVHPSAGDRFIERGLSIRKKTSGPVLPDRSSKFPAYGEGNKVFTKDRAAKAREILKQKLGQINMGLDPEMIAAGLDLAGYHIEAGARSFAAYSKKMIEELGDAIKPYLKSFYMAVRNYPEFDNEGMDSEAALNEQEKVDEVKARIEKPNRPLKNQLTLRGDYGVTSINGYDAAGEQAKVAFHKDATLMAGINLKTVMKLQPGSLITLEYEGRRGEYMLSGFFEKGGAEDSAIIVPLAAAWHLTGTHQKLNAILIRGRSGTLDEIVQGIRGFSPDILVRTLRQVAKAEESLLMKIQLLMGLVTIVVLLATAISVASTMGANVLERRGEIGLMKAMGATRREISFFYAAEAVLIGFAGGVAGFILGAAAAEAVSKGAFNSFVGYPGSPSFCITSVWTCCGAHRWLCAGAQCDEI